MSQKYILRTRDGVQYILTQREEDGPWTFESNEAFTWGWKAQKFNSLSQALDGVVQRIAFDLWSKRTRALLVGLNRGKAL
jgi:hypothetical protein